MQTNKSKIIDIILSTLICISVIWIIWLSLTPIIDRDALRFHLSFAKLWAEQGFLYFRPYFAYYDLNMLNLDYIYMIVYKFGLSDQFTKIIHASFLIGGSWIVFSYLKNKYNFKWGAVSFLFYISIPIHQRLASEVYVDLGLLFFSTLATINFVRWLESDFKNNMYFYLSAVGAGLCFGTKYNGMIISFFLTLFTGLVISREMKNDKKALKSMFIYALIIFVLACPWLIRNYVNSSNPFFPLFRSVFNSTVSIPDNLVANVEGETANRILNGKEGIISLFLIPIRVFLEGKDNDFLKFDGVLNPLMLFLLFLIFFPRSDKLKIPKINLYLFSFFVLLYLTTLYANDIRIRYFIPSFPALVILNIECLKKIYSIKKFKLEFYFVIILLFAFNLNYSMKLYSKLHLNDYNPFSKYSKTQYLSKYLINYQIYEYINENTPQESVIYESMTGGRSYYVNRTFYCDTSTIDRYLLELAEKGAERKDYIHYFSKLPNSDLKATHLIFKPKSFIHTFFKFNHDENDPDNIKNKKKVKGLIDFLDSLKILKEYHGTYVFEL